MKGSGKRCQFGVKMKFLRYCTGEFSMIVGSFWSRPCVKILICRCVVSCWTPRMTPTIFGNFPEISWKFPGKLPETPQKFPYTPGVPHTHIIPPHPLPTHPILPPSISPIPQLQSRFSPFFIFPLSAHLFPNPFICILVYVWVSLWCMYVRNTCRA